MLTLLAGRYVAGDEMADAIEKTRALNADGVLATIDNLGENVADETEARRSVAEYSALLEKISSTGVRATVSLKPTHLGLDLGPSLALENALAVVEKAKSLGNFVRLDMEGSAYTSRTIELALEIRKGFENIGVALQSSLKRSADDLETLIEHRVPVRLVKGAYKEPPEIAFARKKDVDENFRTLMKELLKRGVRPAIATHDERLIDEAVSLAGGYGLADDGYELQMLMGIKRGLQKRLAGKGRTVRVYVPYGRNSAAYLLRRLGERRQNLLFVLRNIVD